MDFGAEHCNTGYLKKILQQRDSLEKQEQLLVGKTDAFIPTQDKKQVVPAFIYTYKQERETVEKDITKSHPNLSNLSLLPSFQLDNSFLFFSQVSVEICN